MACFLSYPELPNSHIRAKSKKSKDKDEDVIYIDDDIYFDLAVKLAEQSAPIVVGNDMLKKLSGLPKDQEVDEKEQEDFREEIKKMLDKDKGKLKPKKHFTITNYKKLRTTKTREKFVMDALVVLGKGSVFFALVDKIIKLGNDKELEDFLVAVRDQSEEFDATFE